MKAKIIWPLGIVVALASFMIFILSFLYKATFVAKYDHHLVSEEYYKDELKYQGEINKLENAAALEMGITLTRSSEGVLVHFPENMNGEKIKGTVYFIRLADENFDFQKTIALKNTTLLIQDEKLLDGRWNVKIDWSYEGTLYLFKDKFNY
ncbi:MAG: cytochrome C oxidase Cbb3 [Flavobacteriaceae bacterium]|nr:MAG: cytochrome C oxidase Cbb3 [Flavobacteriaceae bacterium]